MVSLRMAAAMGFEALYTSGYGTVASHLGLPDVGLEIANVLDRLRSRMSQERHRERSMAIQGRGTPRPATLDRRVDPRPPRDDGYLGSYVLDRLCGHGARH